MKSTIRNSSDKQSGATRGIAGFELHYMYASSEVAVVDRGSEQTNIPVLATCRPIDDHVAPDVPLENQFGCVMHRSLCFHPNEKRRPR